MKLPLSLEYKLEAEARRAMIELAGGKVDATWLHYANTPGNRFVLACFAALLICAVGSGSLIGVCVWVAAMGFCSVWIYRTGVFLKNRTAAWIHESDMSPTTLEIRDDGFHETHCGIYSFAPWGAMTHFARHEKLIQVCLANGLNAYIPSSSLEAANSSMADLQEQLISRGVKAKS